MNTTYVEEEFGILTDDNLYLDCILVKPAHMEDEDLRVLRVWVPRFPMTKTSVITCARQEVQSYGAHSNIAHLVFDLRGTGDSDGLMGNTEYDIDLRSIAAWAEERFGRINFGFLGFPHSEHSKVHMWPLRPGTMLESYRYSPVTKEVAPPTILYLSTYGNFSKADDALCYALATAGYDVYGLDPFRYLLHASLNEKLSPRTLHEDIQLLIDMLPSPPILIAQPLAAGLALFVTAVTQGIRGTITIGKAQSGLTPKHIFDERETAAFQLPRLIPKITTPIAFIQHQGHALGGDEKRLQAYYQLSQEPHRLEKTERISAGLLLNLLQWVQENQPEMAGAA